MLEQKLMEQITKLKNTKGKKEGKTIIITIIIKNNNDSNKKIKKEQVHNTP